MKAFLSSFLFLILSISSVFAQSNTRGANPVTSNDVFQTKTIKAIIIGVSDYKNIPPLEYADDDAMMFHDFLLERPEIDPDNITLLLNSDAIKENILTKLAAIAKDATENDLFIIFFAGHGDKHTSFSDRTYLLLSDVSNDGEYDLSSAIEIRDIQSYASRAIRNGATVFLAIDACHSGEFFDEREPELRSSIVKDINDQWRNLISITACGADELSQENIKWGGGHGVFTFYLVNGLKGASDKNGDNKLSFSELRRFVSDSVESVTKGDQIPQFSQDNGKITLLSTIDNQKAEAVASISNPSVFHSSNPIASTDRGISRTNTIAAPTKSLIIHFENLIKEGKIIKPLESNDSFVSEEIIPIADQEFKVNEAHSQRVFSKNAYAITHSPNGRHIAIGGEEDLVKILDSKTHQIIQKYPHGGVRSLAYSPNGRFLASGSWLNTIKVWDTQNNQVFKTLTGPTDDTRSVCFSPSGKYLVAGGDDKTIRIWETDTWSLIKVFSGKHKSKIYSVSFVQDDNTIVSGDGNGKLFIWDINSEKITKTLYSKSAIKAIEVVGYNIIYSDRARHLVVWSILENKIIDQYDLGINSISSIKADYSGNYIFVAGNSHQVKTIIRVDNNVVDACKAPHGITTLSLNPSSNTITGVTFKGFLFSSEFQAPIKQFNNNGYDYAFDCYTDLIELNELNTNNKEKLKASLGAGLLLFVRQTITPFVNGSTILPDSNQIVEAKRCVDAFIDLYKDDELLCEKARSSKMLLEVYETIVNNDFASLTGAVRKLDQINKAEPGFGYTYNTQTLLYQKLNDISKATECASIAIERIPNWTEPKSNLGKTHFLNHDYDAAIAEFNKIVLQRPDLSLGYNNLGNVYSFLNSFSKADEYYNIAIALDSTNPLLYCNYAEMLIKQKNYSKAETILNLGIDINSDYSLLYFILGNMNYKQMVKSNSVRFLNSASSFYTKAIELNPKDPQIQLSQAKLYFSAYNNPTLRRHHNNTFNKTKVRIIVAQSCDKALELNPYLIEAYYWRALNTTLFHKSKSLNDAKKNAVKSIKNLINKYPDIPESYFFTAKIYMAFDDEKNAAKYLKLAIEKDNMHAPSYKALVYLYKSNKDSQKLKTLLSTIEDTFPEDKHFTSSNMWVKKVAL